MIKWGGPRAKAVKTVSFWCSIKASSSHPSWVESCSRCLYDKQWSAYVWSSVYSQVPLFYASSNDQMARHTSQIKQELSHDSIARLNSALPITKIRAVA